MDQHQYVIDLGTARYEVLRTLAFDRRTTMAALIREALDQYLAREATKPKTRRGIKVKK